MDQEQLIAAIQDLQSRLDKLETQRINQQQILPSAVKASHLSGSPVLANGTILYSDQNNNFISLPIGTAGQELTVANGVPSWQTPSATIPASFTASGTGSGSTSSSTMADLGCSASITTTSKCNIYVIAQIQAYANPGTTVEYLGQILDGASAVVGIMPQLTLIPTNRRQQMPLFGIQANKAAGTYSYKLQHRNGDNTTTCTAEQAQIVVIAIPTV